VGFAAPVRTTGTVAAVAALTVTELNGGQLRVEGEGATPNVI
jgi:hypothetical protein